MIKFTEVNESFRTYRFAEKSFTIHDIVSINISKSGHHRINTKDGKKFIVAPGWLNIEFAAKEWTF